MHYKYWYSSHRSAKYPKSESPATSTQNPNDLDHESLNLILQAPDLVHEITGLVGGDASGDDGSADTASTAESGLRWDVDVGDVLVLAEQRQVQQDGEGSGVGGEDDDLGNTAVQGLGGLVGSLLQLLVVGGLLDNVQNLLAESCVGGGPGCERRQDVGGENLISRGALTSRSVFFCHFECGLGVRFVEGFGFSWQGSLRWLALMLSVQICRWWF